MLTIKVFRLLASILNFYEFLIIAWALLSWLPMREGSFFYDLYAAVARLVEPFINLFRRFIPALGGIDFSPVFAIIALQLIEKLLFRLLAAII